MNLENFIISGNCSIMEAMKKIDLNARGIVFVCTNNRLEASVSDGDIRRSIVKKIGLDTPVSEIANYRPKRLKKDEHGQAQEYMRKHVITAVPIVEDDNTVQDIKFLLEKPLIPQNKLKTPVVIMAGGKGARLKPYTDILPKPLIPVGDNTIVEHILEHFQRFGCEEFYMIVNYKKNFIKSYFADCDKNWNLHFVEEQEFYGTGGGLSLVKDIIKEPFFMTNCDILIEEDYSHIMSHHKENGNIITLVCAEKRVTMPYGTIEISEEGYVTDLREKPSFLFHTNTGLYVIDPKFVDKIPEKTRIDITEIIQTCIDEGEKVGVYLIDEDKWMDMGQLEELDKMKERLGVN